MGSAHKDGDPRVLMLGKGWFPDDIGGLDRYFRELHEHLPGAAGVVVGPASDAPPTVSVVSLTSERLPRRLVGVARTAARRADAADVVDAHFALYAFLPVVFGALRRKPLVVHFQGPWADENVSAGDSSALRRRARARIERTVYRRADAVVTLSHAFGRIAIERYGVSPWRVHVERPGVDIERHPMGERAAARARLRLPDDAFIAVCVRRLVPRMGIEVLLDAWDEPDGRVRRLLVVGDGPLRPSLEERVADSATLRGSVRLLGKVDATELLDAYRAADVNVVPTLAFEGFGLVVLEAAACGTPSIVTGAGGLPQAVGGAPGAEVVLAGDVPSLRRGLACAAAHQVPRQALREWAQLSAWPKVAERHLDLANRVARGASDPHRLRVVVLDHVAQLSGGEIALLRLLPHLDDVDVHVVLAEDGPFADKLAEAGISVQVLALGTASQRVRRRDVHPRRLPWRALWESGTYVVRLAWLLRRARPDLVHVNSLKSGLYGGLAARLAGLPVVWHLHDRLDPAYLPRPAVAMMRRAVARLSAAVIANSHSTAATLRASSPVTVVPTALPATLPPAHEPTDTGGLVVGMVGRFTPWKGQDVFLRAFAAAFPDGPQEAVLVGAPLFGEERYELELRGLVDRLGIADRVCFRGFREDVWRELDSMDVLVHASTSPEPFGQAVQEGMAIGLPVIAADAGGPAEFIVHDVNGLLVSPGDVPGLAAALRRLASDVDLRTRLGAAAREGNSRYAPELVAAQVRGVYAAVRKRDV